MAAAILSQDILAICLVAADGNVDLSLEEVIQRVEHYQDEQDRHFGITKRDFRNLFNVLLYWEMGVKNIHEKIDDVKLSSIMDRVLMYHDAYFNDEGEHWTKDESTQGKEIDFSSIEWWYGYDREEYREKVRIKQELVSFFRHDNAATRNPAFVNKFMRELNITDDILYSCSRPGEA